MRRKIRVSEAGFTAYPSSGPNQLTDSEVQSYGVAMLIIHCKNDAIHTYWEPNGPLAYSYRCYLFKFLEVTPMVSKEEKTKQGNGTEYRESKSHNHVKSNHQKDVYMVSLADNKVCFSLSHQNKQVKVTLEFPERSDQKAEQELIGRLKAIYLKKIKRCHDSRDSLLSGARAMQKEDLALQSPTAKDKEENGNG